MINDFLDAEPRQQRSQLDTLGSEQLNQLIHELEVQKEKLPAEDHLIINWGISLVRAKLREETAFMCRIDQEWRMLRARFSNPEIYVTNSRWKYLNLAKAAGKNKLYKAGREDLRSVVRLSVKEGRIRDDDFEGAVIDIKSGLQYICNYRSESQLYSDLILKYKKYFSKSAKTGRFPKYYQKMCRALD